MITTAWCCLQKNNGSMDVQASTDIKLFDFPSCFVMFSSAMTSTDMSGTSADVTITYYLFYNSNPQCVCVCLCACAQSVFQGSKLALATALSFPSVKFGVGAHCQPFGHPDEDGAVSSETPISFVEANTLEGEQWRKTRQSDKESQGIRNDKDCPTNSPVKLWRQTEFHSAHWVLRHFKCVEPSEVGMVSILACPLRAPPWFHRYIDENSIVSLDTATTFVIHQQARTPPCRIIDHNPTEERR